MAYATKIVDSDGNEINFKDNISGYTSNVGTVTSVATGAGLTGGPVTSSGTIKCALKSETKSSLTAASKGTTSSREYPVGLDSAGLLSVNVPWTNTTLTAGTNISISSGKIGVANVGTLANKTGSNISVANNTAINLLHLQNTTSTTDYTLGKYILIGNVAWSKNQNGFRRIYFSSDSAGSAWNRYAQVQTSSITQNSSDAVYQQVYCIRSLTSSPSHIYLIGYQSSGATLTASYIGIQMIRIA